jgi:hypothetical protein
LAYDDAPRPWSRDVEGQRNVRRSTAKATRQRWSKSRANDTLLAVNHPLTTDTHPAVEALLIDGYRKMTPSQKLERVRAMTQAVQRLALLDIRRRHPDADERELALRLASRWLAPETIVAPFGWNPQERGY